VLQFGKRNALQKFDRIKNDTANQEGARVKLRYFAKNLEKSRAIGALAVGAMAFGALAIGALAIGRLVIGKVKIGELEVDTLRVRKLEVIETHVP
jgi:hypothetical protein